jgi:hypothetical protein
MKNILGFLVLIIVTTSFACKDESENDYIEIAQVEYEVAADQNQIEITIKGTRSWEAASDQTWCRIEDVVPKEGKLLVVVMNNEQEESRQATITVATASASKEVKVVQKGKGKVDLSAIFTDRSYSVLKEGVTADQIDLIKDERLQSIAMQLLNKQYEGAEYRIQKYEPYMPLDDLKEYLGNARPYNKFENPTGIRIAANEMVHIYAEGIGDELVRILVANHGVNDGATAYKIEDEYYHTIQDGENLIQSSIEGNLYIDYYTSNYQQASKPTIHIATGMVCAYFDVAKHDNTYWAQLLELDFDVLDIKGRKINMAYSREILKEYCPNNGVEMVNAHDEIVRQQHDMMGINKYQRVPKNHMFAGWNPYGKSPYAGGHGVYVPSGGLQKWVSVWTSPVDDAWGLYHELGHINEMNGFRWNGTQEVVNNLFACWNDFQLEAPTSWRYEYTQKEDLGDGLGKVIMGPYQLYLNQVVHAPGVDWNSYADFTDENTGRDKTRAKVSFLWQLQLYFKEVLGKDAYENYFEILRTSTVPSSTAEKQINFYKYFCDAVEMDLTELFDQVKMLAAYSSLMGNEQVEVTAQMVNQAKAYVAAKNYPKPQSSAIYYISARTLEDYKNQTPLANAVVGEGISVSGNVAVVSNDVWEGAVAFEACQGEEVISCSISYTGSENNSQTYLAIPLEMDNVKAVAWDGTKKIIYQNQ